MIWSKTTAGRAEIQTRGLVKDRAQRNLLLLVDGVKTQEVLLSNVVGSKPADFDALEALGLIAAASSPLATVTQPMPLGENAPSGAKEPAADAPPQDYARFTETLTQLISSELGLRGFTLTLALEKADSIDALRAVADRVLKQILERKGEPAAEAARRKLYG